MRRRYRDYEVEDSFLGFVRAYAMLLVDRRWRWRLDFGDAHRGSEWS